MAADVSQYTTANGRVIKTEPLITYDYEKDASHRQLETLKEEPFELCGSWDKDENNSSNSYPPQADTDVGLTQSGTEQKQLENGGVSRAGQHWSGSRSYSEGCENGSVSRTVSSNVGCEDGPGFKEHCSANMTRDQAHLSLVCKDELPVSESDDDTFDSGGWQIQDDVKPVSRELKTYFKSDNLTKKTYQKEGSNSPWLTTSYSISSQHRKQLAHKCLSSTSENELRNFEYPNGCMHVYECKTCHAYFKNSQSLLKHECTDRQTAILLRVRLGCGTCGRLFVNKEDLSEHQERKHDKMPDGGEDQVSCNGRGPLKVFAESVVYECRECGILYATKDHLLDHQKKLSMVPALPTHGCDRCSQLFVTECELLKHEQSHDVTKLYQCEVCEKCFHQEHQLKDHTRRHTLERPYHCKECNKAFNRRSHLERHYHTRAHTDGRPHACTLCDKTFIKIYHLQIHMKSHTGDKPFLCKYCGNGFISQRSLDRHVTVHTGEKQYVCKHCGRAITDYSAFQVHVKIHTNDRRHACEGCGLRFITKAACARHCKTHLSWQKLTSKKCSRICLNTNRLKSHITTRDPEPVKECRRQKRRDPVNAHMCEYCGKDFKTRGNLTSHMVIHSDHKEHTCELCDKAFRHKCSLKKHKLSHSGECPFACKVCKRAFHASSDLAAHMRIHSGAKLHKCEQCGLGFARKTTLTRHISTHSGMK